MTASSMSPPEDRLGPFSWAVVLIGWLIIAVAIRGAWTDPRLGDAGSWSIWVLGAAFVHDAVLLPLVIGVGFLIARVLPVPWRTPVRSAAVIGGIITLTVWPIANRWGAREDNPSILPLPVARNLAIVLAVLAVLAIAGGMLNARRSAQRTEPEDAR